MSEELTLSTQLPLPQGSSIAARAVAECVEAWNDAYRLASEQNISQDQSLRMAAFAYRLQIPKMDSVTSIRSAFACIAHGISLQVFEGSQASQLLYAAQVATSLYHRKGAKK